MSKKEWKKSNEGIRYTDEFKSEAIKQITERGHDVADVATRLGVSTKSLYKWMREADLQKRAVASLDMVALKQEVARLNAALKRIWGIQGPWMGFASIR